ncbi:MAG: hypothetical protein R3E66_06390 [bacterium]
MNRILLIVLVMFGLCEPAFAQDEFNDSAPPAEVVQVVSAPVKTAVTTAQKVLMTSRIRDLSNGKLDPTSNAEKLFAVSPEDTGEFGFDALMRAIDAPKFKTSKPKEETEEHRVDRELFEARVGFLRLPTAKRDALLETHRLKREAYQAQISAQKAEIQHLAKVLKDLNGMFEGKGPGDSADALELDPLSASDILLNADRRKAFLGESSADSDIAAKLRADIDKLRKKFWDAPAEERAKLLKPPPPPEETVEVVEETPVEEGPDPEELERQRKAETEAARAERERQAAIEAAKTARTESLRLIAGEKARLLGVKQQHAQLETEFIDQEKAATSTTEAALAAARKVRELEQRSVLDGDKEGDANKLYDNLIDQLRQIRSELDTVLTEINSGETGVESAGELPELPVQINVPEMEDLNQLFEDVKKSAAGLREREAKLRWDRAIALRDAMVTVNDSRLRLLKSVSTTKRDALTGFGAPGVAQVVREFEQISLAARYHILAIPRLVGSEGDIFMASPIVLVLLIIKFLFLVSLFIWWRRQADSVLKRLHTHWYSKRPQTDMTRRITTTIWYVGRVRIPLEWLLFLWLLSGGTAFETWPEVEFAKIVALWSLLGSFVIKLVDAIAEHQGDRIEGTSTDALRVKSLRLVGVTIVAVGLTLSITEASVGQGAIYGWVKSTSWFFAIPITALLVYWWRPIVFERVALVENPNGFLTWVAGHTTGPAGYVSAAIGGVYLLGEGLFRWVYTQISDWTTTRRVLAYLFRREVEKQASKVTADVLDRPIDREIYDKFDPKLDDVVIEGYMAKAVAKAHDVLTDGTGSVVAVVGERGLGKSDILHRVLEGIPEDKVLVIKCDFSGFDGILEQLRLALHLPDSATASKIADEIAGSDFVTIAIDDSHRLIRPVIGGLKGMDALLELTRGTTHKASWILTIDAPAWQYLRRARAGQAVFDHTINLERWTEEQIAAFIEARCTSLGLVPNFDRLVVPTQNGSSPRGGEQTKGDYYRILWDYSRGNPSVAMQYWRDSLRGREHTDEVSVKLMRPPAPAALSDIPTTHHFVLRTIVQLEQCEIRDIVECTGLSHAEARDAIRLGVHREYIQEVDGRLQISLSWYRAVIDLLTRQHLLALGGA